MQKDILKKANILFYLLIAMFIAIVQSTIFGYFPLDYVRPDILLIVAVYFGFRRSLAEGGVFIILSSAIVEAHSGAGKHFMLTTNLYAFLIAKLLSRVIVVPDFLSTIGIVTGLTIAKRVGLLILLGLLGRAENGVRHFFVYLLPGLVIQALLTPACFAWFTRLDLLTHKLDEEALGRELD